MDRIIISILGGLLPEVFYFTLFFIKIKRIESRRILFFFFIAMDYLVLILLNNYIIVNYLAFTILFYIILKVLYKEKENLTFEEMGDRLDIQTNRITERLDRIAFALRLYCGI